MNQWAEMIEYIINGKLFFEETATEQRYFDFLGNELMPIRIEIFPNVSNPQASGFNRMAHLRIWHVLFASI